MEVHVYTENKVTKFLDTIFISKSKRKKIVFLPHKRKYMRLHHFENMTNSEEFLAASSDVTRNNSWTHYDHFQ